jgi:hypothetical protein
MITLHDGSEVADGTPVRGVNGKKYLLTFAEQQAQAAARAAELADEPRRAALAALARLDAVIPRWGEDVIAALALDVAKLPQNLQAALAAKQAEREKLA